MKLSWENDANHLTGHWDGDAERNEYRPVWMQDSVPEVPPFPAPPQPDFAQVSPFTRSEWRADRPATKK